MKLSGKDLIQVTWFYGFKECGTFSRFWLIFPELFERQGAANTLTLNDGSVAQVTNLSHIFGQDIKSKEITGSEKEVYMILRDCGVWATNRALSSLGDASGNDYNPFRISVAKEAIGD